MVMVVVMEGTTKTTTGRMISSTLTNPARQSTVVQGRTRGGLRASRNINNNCYCTSTRHYHVLANSDPRKNPYILYDSNIIQPKPKNIIFMMHSTINNQSSFLTTASSVNVPLNLERETLALLSQRAYELTLEELTQITTYIETNELAFKQYHERLEKISNSNSSNSNNSNNNDIDNSEIRIFNQYQITEQNIEYIHKLMTACTNYKSIEGAELTLRLLMSVTYNAGRKNNVGEIVHYGPTSKMYTIAMNSWTQLSFFVENNDDHHNTEEYKKIRKRQDEHMDQEEEEEEEDLYLYLSQRALQVLDFMWMEYDKNMATSIKPDIIHYTIVLSALAKTSSRKAIHLAHSLLQDAEEKAGLQYLLDDDDDDGTSENGANSEDKQSTTTTDQNKFDANLVPDRLCYNIVLHLWSRYYSVKSDQKSSSSTSVVYPSEIYQNMQDIISKMQRLKVVLDDDNWLPSTKSYNYLLQALSNFRNFRNSVEEAENILRLMYDHHHQGTADYEYIGNHHKNLDENHAVPNIYTFNALLLAYASIENCSEQITRRGQSVLSGLIRGGDILTYPAIPHVRPNIVTINAYLKLLANSSWSYAAEEARDVLMFLMCNDEHTRNFKYQSFSSILDDPISRNMLSELQLRPDDITVSTVLHAIANSKTQRDCGVVANEIMTQLQENDPAFTFTESIYSGAVKVWVNQAKLHNDGAFFFEAEDALKEMENQGHRPTIELYNSVLSLSSLEFRDEAEKLNVAIRCRTILSRLMDNTTNDSPNFQPNIYSFNHIIKACSRFHDTKNMKFGFFTALDTFNALNQSTYCDANEQTYIHMFKVLQNLVTDEAECIALCEELFQKCCQAGLTTNAVLRIIENILPKTSLRRLSDCKKDPEKKLVVNNLPSEWSTNRRVGQNKRRNRKHSWRRH